MTGKRRSKCNTALILVALFGSSTAYAGPFDLYGAGARGSAMGAQVAQSQGPWAIYYNVGALTEASVGATVGAFATHNGAQILLMDRPAGYDIPTIDAANVAPATDTEVNPRRDTDGLDPMYGLVFGGVTSLGTTRLRLGFIAFLPTQELLALPTHYNDERERLFSNQLKFELIDQHPRRFDAEAGIAYRMTDWASFGIGGTFLTGADVATVVYLQDPTDQSDIDINADVHTVNRWGLLAGLQLRLPQNIQVGVAYRGPVAFRISGENRLQVSGIADDAEQPRQELDWTPKYSPGSLALGLSWQAGDYRIAADAKWVLWSDYRDSHSQRTTFEDVLQTRLGLEYTYTAEDQLRLGVGFDPSPVPEQDGRTNYVDNDRFLASLGSSHQVLVAGVGFEFSWFLQFQLLLTRETNKSTQIVACSANATSLCDEVPDNLVNPRTGQPYPEAQGAQIGNPGFPGYTSGGWIGALGAEVTF